MTASNVVAPSPGPLSLKKIVVKEEPKEEEKLVAIEEFDNTSPEQPEEEDDVDETGSEIVLESSDDEPEQPVERSPSDDDIVYYDELEIDEINGSKFEPMKKKNGIYVVPFKKSVNLQTPIVVLKSELCENTAAYIKGNAKFVKFVQDFENKILETVVNNKEKWLDGDDSGAPSDDVLKTSFKTFVDHDGVLKVKVDKDVVAFDEHGELVDIFDVKHDSAIRCIIESKGISFGKIEFGTMFVLSQVQVIKKKSCKIKCNSTKTCNDFE